jgi:hypothetical protein
MSSVAVSAQVVVGFLLDQAVRVVQTTRAETKYNNDTGAPYQKEVVEKHLLLGNARLPDHPDDCPEEWELPDGLQVFACGDMSRSSGYPRKTVYRWHLMVLGVACAAADDAKSVVAVDLLEVSAALQQMQELRTKYQLLVEPALHLVLSASY